MSTISVAIEALIEDEVQRRVADAASVGARPYTVKRFAGRVGLAPSTVYGLVRDGKLRTVDSGTDRVLIPAVEVSRMLAGDAT